MQNAVIIATYNEAKNIAGMIGRVFSVLSETSVIVVDDASPDGTGEIVTGLKKKYGGALILISRNERGLGSACLAGMKKALELNVAHIFTMDADFSHDPCELPKLLKKINEGYDVVIGSRYVEGGTIRNWSFLRWFGSRTANRLARSMLGLKVNDTTTSFRCYKSKALKRINLNKIRNSSYPFVPEILWRLQNKHLKIAEVPTHFADRKAGVSKLPKMEFFRFVSAMFQLHSP